MGRFYGHKVVAVFCDTSLEIALTCNRLRAQRGEKSAVPERVIAKMYMDLVPPNKYDQQEFDEVIVVNPVRVTEET